MPLYNVDNPIEKRQQQELPEPNQLKVPPPGGIIASDGRLNGGIPVISLHTNIPIVQSRKISREKGAPRNPRIGSGASRRDDGQ